MKDAYDDIRSRISEPPLWWNRYGVPRYEEPSVPEHLLGVVGCQSCERVFVVSPIEPVYVRNPYATKGNVEVKEDAELDYKGKSHLRLRDDWGYGDPPRHGCIGDSMSAVPRHSWDKDYYSDSLFPDPDAPFEELKELAHEQAKTE
jgi:hypothetical protein